MRNNANPSTCICKVFEGSHKKRIPKSRVFAIDCGKDVVYNRGTRGEKWGKVGK
jgi:hypothetical protein